MLSEHLTMLVGQATMSQQYAWGIASGLLAFIFLTSFFWTPSLPLVNGKGLFELTDTPARKRFLANSSGIINAGFEKGSVFRVITDNGCKIMLAPKYANEIKSLNSLSFGRVVANDFHTQISGFEPFRQGSTDDRIFQDSIRMKLTQSLASLTVGLSEEASHAFQEHWTNNTDWHNVPVRRSVLDIVAQLSSKVFLGDKLCRNPDWLRITTNYTVHSFQAAEILRLWPWALRPIAAYFLPSCRIIREDLRQAREIINPVLAERRAEKQAAREQGKTAQDYADAMEWMEQCAKGRPYDAAIAQLTFSFAAIHTTTDLLTQVLFDIAGKDDLISALREEIITVFKEEGWKKTMLYQLKLMDSVIKESQRLKPVGTASMRRLATSSLHLSDGTYIPKNSSIFVSGHLMWDETVYPNPETFDPYRFLNLRSLPGKESSSQLVSVTPEHMGFGLGKHACPGRFFAANEIKVALCHILLKYDIRPVEGSPTKPRKMGVSMTANPMGEIAVRRRREEVVL